MKYSSTSITTPFTVGGFTVQVTIVIPTYNAESTISATIDSVRAQTYNNWELIVVDGGSKDHTYNIAFEYSQRDNRIYSLNSPSSASAVEACNYGISERSRSSRCVMVLDSDDMLVPEALESLCGGLIDNRDAVAAYGRFRIIDRAGQPLKTMAADRFTDNRLAVVEGGGIGLLPPDSPLTFNALVLQNCIKSTGQMLVKSDALRRLGPFDGAAFPVDDWDMWIRLSLMGEIQLVDRIVLDYRVKGEDSVLELGEIEPGELYFRRKLVHALAGNEYHSIALAGWRLREKRQISRRFRAAIKSGFSRRKSDTGGVAACMRDWATYLYHWGIWRDADHLPRHARRSTVDTLTVARA